MRVLRRALLPVHPGLRRHQLDLGIRCLLVDEVRSGGSVGRRFRSLLRGCLPMEGHSQVGDRLLLIRGHPMATFMHLLCRCAVKSRNPSWRGTDVERTCLSPATCCLPLSNSGTAPGG